MSIKSLIESAGFTPSAAQPYWRTITMSPVEYPWNEVAVSRDGTKIAATKYGKLYTTSDNGATFNEQTLDTSAYDMAISDDGRIFAATISLLYATETFTGPPALCEISYLGFAIAVAVPATHNKIIVAKHSNAALASTTDYGATLVSVTGLPGIKNWRSLACSASGQYVVAGPANDYLWRSTNYGVTWNAVMSIATGFSALAVTDDGNTVIGLHTISGVQEIFKYVASTNIKTLITPPVTTKSNLRDVAVSADGQTILVASASESVYLSKNGGATWTAQTALGVKNWSKCSISGDGKTAIVAPGGTADQDFLYILAV